MTFKENYADLEHKFNDQVQKDYDEFGSGYFVRNIAPEAPVDFVLIAKEPSGTRKASPPEWEQKRLEKRDNNTNFSSSMGDFILHFCADKYLCQSGETYYITDLAKTGMRVARSQDKMWRRYNKWYPLLIEELELVAKPDKTGIIAIGNDVGDFLDGRGLCRTVGSVLHYSAQAGKARNEAVKSHQDEFDDFRRRDYWHEFESTVEKILTQGGWSNEGIQTKLKWLRKGSKLTDSRKKLMFHYMKRFEELREDDDIVIKSQICPMCSRTNDKTVI